MVGQTKCIRCGTMRILDKTWSETIGISKVTYTQSVCPNGECQKAVEKLLQDRHDVHYQRIEDSLERRKNNIKKSITLRKAKVLENKKLEAKAAKK